jgi:hypothetical protein
MGFDHGFLAAIEGGRRAPSGDYAEAMIRVLAPSAAATAALREYGCLVDEGRRRRADERVRQRVGKLSTR